VNLLEFVAATLSPEDAADKELLTSAFHILDRSHRGAITKEDLKALLGQHFDIVACQEMIKKADADRDGKVNFEDFVTMMKLPRALSGKVSRASFSLSRRSSDTGVRRPSSAADAEPVVARRSSSSAVMSGERVTKEKRTASLRDDLAKQPPIGALKAAAVEVQLVPLEVSVTDTTS
jgi:hypothetical protein